MYGSYRIHWLYLTLHHNTHSQTSCRFDGECLLSHKRLDQWRTLMIPRASNTQLCLTRHVKFTLAYTQVVTLEVYRSTHIFQNLSCYHSIPESLKALRGLADYNIFMDFFPILNKLCVCVFACVSLCPQDGPRGDPSHGRGSVRGESGHLVPWDHLYWTW